MSTSDFEINFASFVLAALLWHLIAPEVPPTARFLRLSDRVARIFLVAVLGVFIAGIWLCAVRDSQLAPHHISRHLGTTEISNFWTTNNQYVTFDEQPVITTNCLEYRPVPVTNEYWHIWSIFRK